MDNVEQPATKKRGRPKKQENQTPFVGFTQERIQQDEYFRMPAIWINVCAEIDNLAELKVVQYVLRHTWGYREYDTAKHIKVDEFVSGRKYRSGERKGERMDFGTGLSDRAVQEGLARAIKHGFLVCITDDRDKGRIKKYYALKMQEEEQMFVDETEGEEEEDITDGNLGVNNNHLPTNNNHPRDEFNSPRTSKNEPIEQTYRIKGIRMPSSQDEEHFIRVTITDYSKDLGDHEHTPSNISQALKIYRTSGMPLEEFGKLLYNTKEKARKATIRKLNSRGYPNRMPYYFSCLKRDLATGGEVIATGN